MAEIKRQTYSQTLSPYILKSATHPGMLKRLIREQVHTNIGGLYNVQEWEDDEGWHYVASNVPLKPRM